MEFKGVFFSLKANVDWENAAHRRERGLGRPPPAPRRKVLPGQRGGAKRTSGGHEESPLEIMAETTSSIPGERSSLFWGTRSFTWSVNHGRYLGGRVDTMVDRMSRRKPPPNHNPSGPTSFLFILLPLQILQSKVS